MPKTENSRLMVDAAYEIESLRRKVENLEGYRQHTERMLTMFEGGPSHSMHAAGESPDIAHGLREAAARIERGPTGN